MKSLINRFFAPSGGKNLRLYLHIGQPKTATTTVQNYLAKNRDALLRSGWLYPNAARQYFAHHLLGNFFVDKPQFWIGKADPKQCLDDLLIEVEKTDCKNVIMSTESLFFISHVDRVKEYFKDFDVVPVVGLRRQDEWIESAYKDDLKNGRISCGPDEYLQRHQSAIDYEARLNLWSEVFQRNKIIVLPFEKGNRNLAVEKVFSSALGIPQGPQFEPAEVQNESLSRDCIEYYSRFEERPRIGLYHEKLKVALGRYSKLNPGEREFRYFFSPSARLKIYESCFEQNVRLGKKYIGNHTESLFLAAPPDIKDAWAVYPGLSVASAVKISEFLLRDLHKDTVKLIEGVQKSSTASAVGKSATKRSEKDEAEKMNQDRPLIFVGGAPRSGTTVTHALLCSSSKANAYCPEISFLLPMVNAYMVGIHNWQKHTYSFFESPAYFTEHMRSVLNSTLERVSAKLGSPDVLCLKDPLLTPSFFWIHRLLGSRVKFVTVVRHPYSVVRSRQEVFNKSGKAFGSADARFAAEEYMRSYQHLNAEELQHVVHALRYESLTENEVLNGLRHFTGLSDISPENVWAERRSMQKQSDSDPWFSPKYYGAINTESRLDPLAEPLRSIVAEVCAPMMERFGYSP